MEGKNPENLTKFDENWRINFERKENETRVKINKFLIEVLAASNRKDLQVEPWVLGVEFSD